MTPNELFAVLAALPGVQVVDANVAQSVRSWPKVSVTLALDPSARCPRDFEVHVRTPDEQIERAKAIADLRLQGGTLG